jgi:hypothetical protein
MIGLKRVNIAAALALAVATPVLAAEVENPTKPQDWAVADRIAFTARWNRANVLNLMRGAAGAQEYRTIGQRTDFYNWFDQIRKVQKHDIMWPAAAWVVAGQMRNLEDPVRSAALASRRTVMGRTVDSGRLLSFAGEGNKAIFDDVFPRLKDAFERGVLRRPLQGDEARAWDKETLRREQLDIVQPIYERYARLDRDMAAELKDLAAASDVLSTSGIAIGNALDFTGDILSGQDRYDHALNVVVPAYNRFESAIDGSRQRRQQAAPDPTAGGMVQSPPTPEDRARKEAEDRKRAEDEARARAAAAIHEQHRRAAEQQRAADAQRAAEEAARRAREEERQEAMRRQRAAEETRRVEAERRAREELERARALSDARIRAEIERARQEAERQRRMAEAARQRQAQEEAQRRAAERGRAGSGMSSGPTPVTIGPPR